MSSNIVPQRIDSMTHQQLCRRVLQLEAANEKCGEAIAAAVAAEREAKDALIAELYNAWKDAPLQIAQRADRAEAMTKAAAIRARNGNWRE